MKRNAMIGVAAPVVLAFTVSQASVDPGGRWRHLPVSEMRASRTARTRSALRIETVPEVQYCDDKGIEEEIPQKEIFMSGCQEIGRYLESCQTEFWQGVFRTELDYLTRHLEGSEDILSVGCGPAIIESSLSERGFRVTGLEVSRETLNCAPDRIRTVAARAEDMPFPESSFDAVIYIASMQFIENYRNAIEKAERVLRPDGKLIAMLLNPESVFFRDRICNGSSYVRKIRHRDINEIERVIAEKFQVQSEYFLGVKGESIFESRDASEAALYIIRGTRRVAKPGEK